VREKSALYFFVQHCGRVRLQEDCKRCIFQGSMGDSGGCIHREQPRQTSPATSSQRRVSRPEDGGQRASIQVHNLSREGG